MVEQVDDVLDDKIDLSKYSIGDYVNYTYDPAGNYKLTSAQCGSSNNPTSGIQQTTGLKWRILNLDEKNGTIDLISASLTKTKVYFYGILGYNNGPYFMNEICKAQYSNKKLGVEARSLNLEDMEKHLTTYGIIARNKCANSVKYGKTKTYTSAQYPSLYANQKGAGMNENKVPDSALTKEGFIADPYEKSKKIAEIEPTTDKTSQIGKPLTVTHTYYQILINETNYGAAYKVLSNTNRYWVAARFVSAYSGYSSFGLRTAYTDSRGHNMFKSDGTENDYSYYLRPVVTLPARLLSENKVGVVWQLNVQ